MKNNKNIDRLFQERFKDFEAEPNEQTWLIIQEALKEEKKDWKILPLWLKYTGIAAAFILGFFALNTIFKSNIGFENKIVLENESSNSPNENKPEIQEKTKEDKKTIELKNNSKIAITETPKITKDEKQTATAQPTKNISSKTPNQKTATVYLFKNNPSLDKNSSKNETLKSNLVLADITNTTDNKANPNGKNEFIIEKGNLAVAKAGLTNETKAPNNETNELEAILKLKEAKKNSVAAERKNKWEIMPNVAAMYPNSKVTGIDPQFNENSKTTDNSIGFGIGVNYAISKKLALRTGINKFALGYNTKNVTYSSGLNTTYLANVDYTTNAMVEVRSNASGNALMTFEKNIQKTNTGTINQKMGYYEVPLEISYVILDKKIGISLIGGISTLFLDENKISLISSETNIKLGEANNLNAMHFSSNIGLGFKYKLVKSFQLNFEPMVKYQLNTFSTNTGNNKGVLIGLYSGISYHF